jgi:hypothetical protein
MAIARATAKDRGIGCVISKTTGTEDSVKSKAKPRLCDFTLNLLANKMKVNNKNRYIIGIIIW